MARSLRRSSNAWRGREVQSKMTQLHILVIATTPATGVAAERGIGALTIAVDGH
jgi:hypothetical protein